MEILVRIIHTQSDSDQLLEPDGLILHQKGMSRDVATGKTWPALQVKWGANACALGLTLKGAGCHNRHHPNNDRILIL